MRYSNVSFDDWKAETKEQQSAKQSAITAADGMRNIIMTGPCGTGKTMLAHCIRNKTSGNVLTVSNLTRVFRDNMKFDTYPEGDLIKELTEQCSYLILDEIGAYPLSDFDRRLINEIIDIRYNMEKPTGLVTNFDIDGLKEIIGERVISRLRGDGGILVAMAWGDQRGKS